MKTSDLSSKNRTSYRLLTYIAASLLAVGLTACGGGGGGDTTAAAPPSTPPVVAPPTVNAAASIATATAVAANDTATAPTAAFTVVQSAGVPVVSIASPPKVNFTVISDGAVVKGLTASNVSVIIAKLVPGTNGTPDQWMSYTYRTETATATVGPGGKPVLASATQATTDPKQTDAALLAAQLVYNDAGYYTYTFSTDIKDPAKTNGVTFEPTLTHRIAIQLSYTNKAAATVRVNPYFDFTIDASGNAVAVTDSSKTRKVVDITTCNECHSKLALHGGGRVDTQFCVMCHNAGTTDANSGNVLDLRTMAHKIHAGKKLKTMFGQDYAIWGYRDTGYDYTKVVFPQELLNCTKCHDGSKKDAAGNPLAAQGDNWKKVPSRAACGSCHAGINFANNTGVTLGDAAKGLTISSFAHIGGAKQDDSQCVLCHDASNIPVYHSDTMPTTADAAKRTMSAEITNVAIDVVPTAVTATTTAGSTGTGNVTVTFTLTDNGVAVTDPAAFSGLALTLSKLNPAASGSSTYWQSYTGRGRTKDATKPPVIQGYSENALAANLTHTGSGVWTYKFQLLNGSTPGDIRTIVKVANATASSITGAYSAASMPVLPNTTLTDTSMTTVSYDWWKTHRVGMEFNKVSGTTTINNKFNAIYDFVPLADSARQAETRNIVSMNTCATCHAGTKLHKGYTVEYCVTCHNQNTYEPYSGSTTTGLGTVSVDLQQFVHKLHRGKDLPSVVAGGSYVINNENYSYGAFPGNIKDCAICHSATATKVNGTTVLENAANWYTTPTKRACGACHDSTAATEHIDAQITSTGTSPGEQCVYCHGPTSAYGLSVKAVHAK